MKGVLVSKGAPFTPKEERALIARCQRGDREAFADLVEAFRERAFAGALSITHNYEDARDLSQEAFIKALKNIGKFQLGRPFYPWYYRILRNTCLTYIQRHGPSRRVSLDCLIEEKHVQFADERESAADNVQRSQTVRHVREAITELKPEFQEILAMKHFEEMTYQEISQALRVPLGTVMSRLYYARKALKEAMKKRGFDGRET